jgi:hypothetical protein
MVDYEEIVREIIKAKNTRPSGIVFYPQVNYENMKLDFELMQPKYNVGHPTQIRAAFQDLIRKTAGE